MEREAVTLAIRNTRNLTEAAERLGASRRTLQNRMRYYGIPRGRSGRPREELPYASASGFGQLAMFAGLVAGAFFIGRWWSRRGTTIAAE